ncbi:MAG TPA: hypothetical protein VK590_00675 [Saprospiraceae bacterium]|nr:hypothetical protein [Saprospiraceae bacterium]
MKYSLFLFAICIYAYNLQGQHLVGMSTRYDTDVSEWVIYPEDEKLPECTIRARWTLPDNPGEWDFRMGDISGVIRLKWKDKMDEWEIIGDNINTRLKMVWPGDPREWRVETSDKEFVIHTKYNIPIGDWELKSKGDSLFGIYPAYQNDIRDWIIQDNLPNDLHITTRIGLCFAVMISNIVR